MENKAKKLEEFMREIKNGHPLLIYYRVLPYKAEHSRGHSSSSLIISDTEECIFYLLVLNKFSYLSELPKYRRVSFFSLDESMMEILGEKLAEAMRFVAITKKQAHFDFDLNGRIK